jgi:hypothetical protein
LEIAGLLGADAQTLELAILFIAQKTITIVFVAAKGSGAVLYFEGNFILMGMEITV